MSWPRLSSAETAGLATAVPLCGAKDLHFFRAARQCPLGGLRRDASNVRDGAERALTDGARAQLKCIARLTLTGALGGIGCGCDRSSFHRPCRVSAARNRAGGRARYASCPGCSWPRAGAVAQLCWKTGRTTRAHSEICRVGSRHGGKALHTSRGAGGPDSQEGTRARKGEPSSRSRADTGPRQSHPGPREPSTRLAIEAHAPTPPRRRKLPRLHTEPPFGRSCSRTPPSLR